MAKSKRTIAPKLWYSTKIPAELFFDILESGNKKDLVIQGKPKEKEIEKAWGKIFDEYFILKDDAQLRLILRAKRDILKLTAKVVIVEDCLKCLSILGLPKETFIEVLDALATIGILIDKEKPLNEEILRILSVDLAGLKTALQLEQDNLKNLTKGQKASFVKNCVNIELCAGVKIDEKVSLKKYIEYEKAAKEITAQRKSDARARKTKR